MKNPFMMAVLVLTLASCSSPSTNPADSCEIMGKTATLDFSGLTIEADYRNETNLHWQTGGKEGDEHVSYKRLAPHLHFLNWIEQDGLTVSHIVNCQNNTVISFLSHHDDSSERGQRAGFLREGTVEFKQ